LYKTVYAFIAWPAQPMSTLIMTHIEPEPKIAFVVITTESTKLQVQHNSLNELIK